MCADVIQRTLECCPTVLFVRVRARVQMQVGSYCPWLDMGYSDLFYRVLPPALSSLCLLTGFALVNQLWASANQLRTIGIDATLAAAADADAEAPAADSIDDGSPQHLRQQRSQRQPVLFENALAAWGEAVDELGERDLSGSDSSGARLQGLRRRLSVFFTGLEYGASNSGFAAKILDGASGEIKSGEITVILGPAGCGKTALLHVLMGTLTPQVGG
jgi:ABC-type multidrug transport system fused ATPase/permease subunit